MRQQASSNACKRPGRARDVTKEAIRHLPINVVHTTRTIRFYLFVDHREIWHSMEAPPRSPRGSSRAGDGRQPPPSAKRAKISSMRVQDGTTASLPAPVWARSFDFLPYADVRSARLVCKLFAHDVPSHMEALHVFHAAEMDVPSAQRYSNVNTVKVFCLFHEEDDGQEKTTVLDMAGIERTPSFLQAFPRLKRAFLGGVLLTGSCRIYIPLATVRPENHAGIFQGFLRILADAFSTRALPSDLDLQCVATMSLFCEENPFSEGTNNACRTCRKVLTHFPLQISILHNYQCMSQAGRFDILSNRRDLLSCLTPELLSDVLCSRPFIPWPLNNKSAGDIRLPNNVFQQMQKRCPSLDQEILDSSELNYFHMVSLQKVKDLLSLGGDPCRVDMCRVINRMYDSMRRLGDGPLLLLGRINLDILSDLGFDVASVNHSNIFVVDEERVPKLRDRVVKFYTANGIINV